MGEMRDSDWSRENLLRSDWLLPSVATFTTQNQELCACQKGNNCHFQRRNGTEQRILIEVIDFN